MADKANKQNVEATNGPPKSKEEIFDEHYNVIRAAKLTLEGAQKVVSTASAHYRNTLNSFKKAGGDSDAMVEALKIAKQDPEEATRRIKNMNLYLRRMGAAIGTQFGIFGDDAPSIASQAEADRLQRAQAAGAEKDSGPLNFTEKVAAAVEQDGYLAGKAGKNNDGGQYTDGSPAFLKWSAGWHRGQAELAAGLNPKAHAHHHGNGEHPPAA